MPHVTPSDRDPVLAVMRAWKADDSMGSSLLKELTAVGTQMRQLTRGLPVTHRIVAGQILGMWEDDRRGRVGASARPGALRRTIEAVRFITQGRDDSAWREPRRQSGSSSSPLGDCFPIRAGVRAPRRSAADEAPEPNEPLSDEEESDDATHQL